MLTCRQPTNYKENHNIITFDLKQKKVFENHTKKQRLQTVYLMTLIRGITTIPRNIANVNQIKKIK